MNTKHLLIFFSATIWLSLLQAEDFRTWKDISGRQFEAKVVKTSTQSVSLENREGKVIKFPIVDLLPEDQKYVRSWTSASEQSDAKEKKISSPIVEAVKGKTTDAINSHADYYGIYFSAHWCPPCRKFTPKLSEFYNKHFKEDGAFDLIFVSSDRSEDAMEDYRKWGDMKFPALKFDKIQKVTKITRYAGNGIPSLVIVDREGKVIADSYKSGKYIGPYKPLAKLETLIGAK